MPMIFGLIQESIGIGIMPGFLLIFAVLNLVLLEITYVVTRKNTDRK